MHYRLTLKLTFMKATTTVVWVILYQGMVEAYYTFNSNILEDFGILAF